MKKFLTTLLVLSGLAASAQAAVIVGLDAGYLVDSEEEFISARVGFEVANTSAFSHQLELEIGYTDTKEFGLKGEIIPLLANYRFVAPSSGAWGYHAGVGAGMARSSIKGSFGGFGVDFNDESFAAQAFAGVTYQAGSNVTLSLGAKYLWIDDVNFAGASVEVGDDVALSAGISFKF
ncbi:MAG: hypothetical protein C0518_10420 [Opitutus sp.]|nr:hypothetical protein [Opitutus sp.]